VPALWQPSFKNRGAGQLLFANAGNRPKAASDAPELAGGKRSVARNVWSTAKRRCAAAKPAALSTNGSSVVPPRTSCNTRPIRLLWTYSLHPHHRFHALTPGWTPIEVESALCMSDIVLAPSQSSGKTRAAPAK